MSKLRSKPSKPLLRRAARDSHDRPSTRDGQRLTSKSPSTDSIESRPNVAPLTPTILAALLARVPLNEPDHAPIRRDEPEN